MKYTLENNHLVIFPEGRVDTENCVKVEEEINRICEGKAFDKITLDMDKVNFLSSAGLRVVLRLKKKYKSLSLINVEDDVYDVFEMTGFVELMSIQRKEKYDFIDLGEITSDWKQIGKGASGTVYVVKGDNLPVKIDEVVVKVFKPGISIEEIRHERDLTKEAFLLGVPTTISYNLCKVGDCYGVICEELDKGTFADTIVNDLGNLDKYAKIHADLLKVLHEAKMKNVPSFKEKELKRAPIVMEHLPKEEGEKYLRMLEEIPECQNLIHGDGHVKNIMRLEGEPCFIDLDTLTHGNPIFEFARLYNAYIGYTEICNQANNHFLGIPYDEVKRLYRLTISHYYGVTDERKIDEIYDKSALIGLAYLYHHYYAVPGFDKRVGPRYDWLKTTLIDLIHRVNTLVVE